MPPDKLSRERVWQKPMFKWRCAVGLFTVSWFLGNMNVLGFHEPREPQGTIIFFGVALLWCVCDAVDALRNPEADEERGGDMDVIRLVMLRTEPVALSRPFGDYPA